MISRSVHLLTLTELSRSHVIYKVQSGYFFITGGVRSLQISEVRHQVSWSMSSKGSITILCRLASFSNTTHAFRLQKNCNAINLAVLLPDSSTLHMDVPYKLVYGSLRRSSDSLCSMRQYRDTVVGSVHMSSPDFGFGQGDLHS